MVVAWNTQRMQAVVDRWRSNGSDVGDDWLRRMGLAHFAPLNFR
nr:Tn3 family transposase [Paraburkholderia piptadeniae]